MVSHSLISKTEITVTIGWAAEDVCDYLWYSVDNGLNWTGTTIAAGNGGSYTVTGLSAGRSYAIRTKVRYLNTQETETSASLTVSTYNYPFAEDTPDFTIGNRLTIGLYNPLSRNVTVTVLAADGTAISSVTTGASYLTGYNDETAVDILYQSLPSSVSGVYSVRVAYSLHTETRVGGTYSVNRLASAPRFGGVAYADTNASSVALTGNNQLILRNQSVVQFQATGIEPRNGATIGACAITVGGTTYSMTVSGSSASAGGITIDTASDTEAVFSVTDSRGISSELTVPVAVIDWAAPALMVDFARQNHTQANTDLTAYASWTSLEGRNPLTINYEITKDGESTPTYTGTLTNGTTETVSLSVNDKWHVSVTATDSLGATTTVSAKIAAGVPLVFYDRQHQSVGVRCLPTRDNTVEIDGKVLRDTFITYRNLTGTAAVTSSPYYCARWDVSDPSVTEYVDGMMACVKVPVAGHSTYGTCFQINSLGYKPVVYNVNSNITTRYGVGSVVLCVYNATQTAATYLGSGSQTITGCWQVMDYSFAQPAYALTYYRSSYVASNNLYRYVCSLSKGNSLIPINSNVGTSPAGSTATNKTMTTEEFDPWGPIFYYATATAVSTGGSPGNNTLYYQNYNLDIRYTLNCGQTLTANAPLYLVAEIQSSGYAKLASPYYAQSLPATDDGKIYIFLGMTYGKYQIELYPHHPVYQVVNGQVCLYTGSGGSGTHTVKFTATDDGDGVALTSGTVLDLYNAFSSGALVYITTPTCTFTVNQVISTVGVYMVSALGSAFNSYSSIKLRALTGSLLAATATGIPGVTKTIT